MTPRRRRQIVLLALCGTLLATGTCGGIAIRSLLNGAFDAFNIELATRLDEVVP